MSTPNEPDPGNAPQPNQPTEPVNTPDPAPPAKPETPQQSSTDMGGLMTALAALPEKIVDSLRESMQPANPPANSGNTQTTSTPPAEVPGTVTTPGKKSFTEWWFGK